MGGEGNDYEMGGAHMKQVQVRMDHIPERVDAHLVQPMEMYWFDFTWKPQTFVNE